MHQVIYIDILFCINLIINYFILIATTAILRRKDARWRLFVGAMLGALYSVFIFFPTLGLLYSSLAKFVFSLSIIIVSYKFKSLLEYIKLLVCFYFITLAFGGIIFALFLFFSPPGMVWQNGVFYFDISPFVLIIASVICYSIIRITLKLLNRDSPNNAIYKLTIETDCGKADLLALLDTGNALEDIISNSPVIIAEYNEIEKIIPKNIRSIFKTDIKDNNNADIISKCEWAERFRVIPYKAVGGENGLLPAFKPNHIEVEGKKVSEKTIVAVCKDKLSRDGQYSALLNPKAIIN
jgi:stage II sporulation protein GA (sporulation sigma-E factor processing peptidase)